MESSKKIKKTINQLKQIAKNQGIDLSNEITTLEDKLKSFDEEQKAILMTHKNELSSWDRVQLARNFERPKPQDFIDHLIKDFIPLHGDRLIGDDHAIIGGIGYLRDIPVTAIGTFRGKNLKENMTGNFGMPHPEGYRKALRLAKQAEKFNRPVLFFIDTPGAFCGIDAEERGISEAIARNLFELATLKVPSFSIITGEGESGGALALGVANKLYMMENAIFSVISPEGCASILFKDASKANIAAESLKITSYDLLELGVINEIIPEGKEGLIGKDREASFKKLEEILYNDILEYSLLEPEEIIKLRIEKYASIGFYDKNKIALTEKVKKNVKETQDFGKELGRFFGFK